ncbi:MAG: cupin domain-containing protein [Actinomycetota bacterium]|nr:cupin domain-containing protein [Actinomycetota bacterium]MDA8398218.1 cupin domain-containing protein [Actinomycetota bacterium]
MTHVIDPFRDGRTSWLGLDEEGFRRKVFSVVGKDLLNSEFMSAGITIFEPGESSSLHNHPESEEVDFIVKGHGEVRDEFGNVTPFDEHTFMFIEKGKLHQHVNTGREPMWLIWIYGPHGQLPTT